MSLEIVMGVLMLMLTGACLVVLYLIYRALNGLLKELLKNVIRFKDWISLNRSNVQINHSYSPLIHRGECTELRNPEELSIADAYVDKVRRGKI